MMRELTEMQILAGASQRALANMTAANQRLQSQVHTLTERLDAVVDLAMKKDAELDAMAGKLAEAEANVARLMDLLSRMGKQRDKAQSELNKTLAVVNAARVLCDELYPNRAGNDRHCGCIECTLVAALATFDAQREEKP